MAKRHDQEFAAWVNERQVTLLRAARIICFDIQNAEDVLQEWKKLDSGLGEHQEGDNCWNLYS